MVIVQVSLKSGHVENAHRITVLLYDAGSHVCGIVPANGQVLPAAASQLPAPA